MRKSTSASGSFCFDSELIATSIADSRLPVFSGIGHEINTTVTDLAAHTFAKTPTAVARIFIARIEEFLKELEGKEEDLLRSTENYFQEQQQRLKNMAENFKRTPVVMVKMAQERMVQYQVNLKKTIHLHLQGARAKITQYERLIDMASPVKTLQRGFSITRGKDGKVIRSAKNIKKTAVLITSFADGQLTSEVV